MIYQKLPNANATVLSVGTIAGTLKSFIETAASTTFDLNALDGIDFNVESGSIRVAFDGLTPSTTLGLLVSGSASFRKVNLSRVSLVSTSGTVSVSIQVGRTMTYESGKGAQSSSGGGGGGTPGSPTGSVQGNNGGSFAGVPNSEINFTSGVTRSLTRFNNPKFIELQRFDDFTSSSLVGWGSTASGGTVNVQQTGPLIANHSGQARFQVTAVGDRITLITTANGNTCFFGNGETVYETAVYFENLSVGSEGYIFYAGFGDTTGAGDMVDGVYLKYDSATSANWILGTANNSTRTATPSSVAVAATTYLGLRIVVNAAGTSAEYFIADLATGVWTSLGTVATNIPTTSARLSSPMIKLEKTVGATLRTVWADYCEAFMIPTTARV